MMDAVLRGAIAGLTRANLSVALAYLTDFPAPGERTRRFVLFNAMLGAGFIIGPLLRGGWGDHWLPLPFILSPFHWELSALAAVGTISRQSGENRPPPRVANTRG